MRGYTSTPVAQAISTVRSDLPDWLQIVPTTATASQFIRDYAAKLVVPPSSIAQVQSSANYLISRMVGSTLTHLGSVMTRPSPGITQAKYNTYTNVVTTSNSTFPVLGVEYPKVKWELLTIRTTDTKLMTWDLNTFPFDADTVKSHLGPILNIRNNGSGPVELYFGIPNILDSAGAVINVDSTIYFRMAPASFVDSW